MPHAVNFFHSLHDAGFVIFSKEANFLWQGRNVEYGFLKLHPDFFINSSLYSKRPSSVYHIESAPIVAENNTKISVVLRTWYEDAELAFTAATSAIQAMGDDMLELVIVTDEGSDKVVRRHLFDPLRKQYNGLVKLHVEKTLLRDGHIQQQFSKIMADTYTKGNLILHLDSDCAVVKWSEDCYLEGGLPVNDFGTFKSLEAHGVGIWKRGTEVALGIDDEENEYSRLNQHVYPRQAYELARRRMEKVHGVPFVKTFQKANFVGYAPQIHEPNVTLFSEFNVIGAAVFHFAPELMFHKNVTAGSNERWRPICITQCSARHFSKKCCEAWFQVQSLQKDKGSIQHHIPDDYCSSLGF